MVKASRAMGEAVVMAATVATTPRDSKEDLRARLVRWASPVQSLQQPGQDPQWPASMAKRPLTHSGRAKSQGLVASPHQTLRNADLTAMERVLRKPLLKSPGVERVAVSIMNNMTE